MSLIMTIVLIIIDKEVITNKPDLIIKWNKREKIHTDRCGNTCRQKCCAKGRGK
jgi:hypothetical protein